VDDDTPLQPQMTYASQKLVGETLVADFSRRSWLDGRSLRLAGVLARPPARTGQLSAFLSDMIRELVNNRPFTCPMSPGATTWAVSIQNVVDNLVHAAALDSASIAAHRTITLPAIRFSMAELVEAIATTHGDSASARVRYAPDPHLESLFGRFPLLETPFADSLGFRHDGDLPALVRRAVQSAADPHV
jgi:nucleoside-diphosphate-sugar epimerase